MCGFAGFVDFEPHQYESPERRHLLTLMGKQLSRRGPDQEQLFDDHRLSFVFRRLSIVDVEGGQQPIWNEDGTIFVAINGEIYNHQELHSQLREKHHFRTQSDAEIVLHLFEERGAEALQYLNGMFAIAIWDRQQQRLFLARDPLGIKPLYYCQVGSQLIFGSELKALLVHPDCPNQPRWNDILEVYPYLSYVREIEMLPGGHYFTFDANQKVSPTCYWSIEEHFSPESDTKIKKPQEYIAEYGELFVDSVRKRLMGDVPIGAFLSGGLDSSSIVAVAKQDRPRLHCFTIVEQYSLKVGEVEQAQTLCQELKLSFHPVLFERDKMLETMDFSLANFEYFIWLMDSPRFSFEWFFKHELHRYAKTLIPELKIMLLGQGADEFAGGYSNALDNPSHSWQFYLEKLKRQEPLLDSQISHKRYSSNPWLVSRQQSKQKTYSTFQREMLRQVLALQKHNLWHEDRSASSQSIEARVPFLDRRLVEYLASIPPQVHETLFWNKNIIRQMAKQWIPASLSDRRKTHSGMEPSLYQFMNKFIVTIFPEFREKYLESSDTLFSRSNLLQLFERANPHNPINRQNMDKLLNCMAMIVFNDLCKTLRYQRPIGYVDRPSPWNEALEISVLS